MWVCTVYSERGGDRMVMRLKSWEFKSTVSLVQSPHLQAYRTTYLKIFIFAPTDPYSWNMFPAFSD